MEPAFNCRSQRQSLPLSCYQGEEKKKETKKVSEFETFARVQTLTFSLSKFPLQQHFFFLFLFLFIFFLFYFSPPPVPFSTFLTPFVFQICCEGIHIQARDSIFHASPCANQVQSSSFKKKTKNIHLFFYSHLFLLYLHPCFSLFSLPLASLFPSVNLLRVPAATYSSGRHCTLTHDVSSSFHDTSFKFSFLSPQTSQFSIPIPFPWIPAIPFASSSPCPSSSPPPCPPLIPQIFRFFSSSIFFSFSASSLIWQVSVLPIFPFLFLFSFLFFFSKSQPRSWILPSPCILDASMYPP